MAIVQEYWSPTVSLFGYGCRAAIGTMMRERGFRKALVVTDRTLVEIGIVEKVTCVLTEAGIQHLLFTEVKPNPTIGNVDKGLALLKEEGCDVIVTVGGGSAHDCGKAIGILATNGGSVPDYIGLNKSAHPSVPIVAVNTTAGTGSICTRAYVITREETEEKFGIRDKHALATIAVDDHELMMGLPAGLTAGTGMDVITHAIECYTSINAYQIPRELALGALRLSFAHLEQAVKEGTEESRAGMAAAEYLAGLAFGNAGCGMVHAMSHQLSAVYDLPHGLCNAILLPAVMRFNGEIGQGTLWYAQLGDALFPHLCKDKTDAEKAEVLFVQVEALSKSIGTYLPLCDLGVKEEDFGIMADKALVDGSMRNNVRQPSKEQVEAVYASVCKS